MSDYLIVGRSRTYHGVDTPVIWIPFLKFLRTDEYRRNVDLKHDRDLEVIIGSLCGQKVVISHNKADDYGRDRTDFRFVDGSHSKDGQSALNGILKSGRLILNNGSIYFFKDYDLYDTQGKISLDRRLDQSCWGFSKFREVFEFMYKRKPTTEEEDRFWREHY